MPSLQGVTFLSFTIHMAGGIVIVMIQTYIQLRYKFRNLNDLRFIEPQNIQELRHEIAIWQRAAASLSSYSKDEDLVRETLLKKVGRLQRQLKKKLSSGSAPPDNYQQTLEELQEKVCAASIFHLNFITILLFILLKIKSSFPTVSNTQLAIINQIGCNFGVCH